jgi:hypothetical protein
MPISRTQARALTTKTEQTLVEESFHPRVRAFSVAQLRQRIDRARRMRDKYSDLGRRQHGASKARKGQASRPPDKSNLRTDRKVTLFDQTLERFEKRLQSLEAEAARAQATTASPAAGGRARAEGRSKPPAKARRGGGGSAKPQTAPTRDDKRTQARGKAVRGHTKARGRRTQTRKDSR